AFALLVQVAFRLGRVVVDGAPHRLVLIEPGAAAEGDEGPGLRIEIAVEQGDVGVAGDGADDAVMRVAHPDRQTGIVEELRAAAKGQAGPAAGIDIGKADGAAAGERAIDDLPDLRGELELGEDGRCLLCRHAWSPLWQANRYGSRSALLCQAIC